MPNSDATRLCTKRASSPISPAVAPPRLVSASVCLVDSDARERGSLKPLGSPALGIAPDQAVSVSWIRDTVLAVRAGKGMVLDDADHDTHSAGSFFNNPIVPDGVARTLPAE